MPELLAAAKLRFLLGLVGLSPEPIKHQPGREAEGCHCEDVNRALQEIEAVSQRDLALIARP